MANAENTNGVVRDAILDEIGLHACHLAPAFWVFSASVGVLAKRFRACEQFSHHPISSERIELRDVRTNPGEVVPG